MLRLALVLTLVVPALARSQAGGWLTRAPTPPPPSATQLEPPTSGGLTMTTIGVEPAGARDFAPYDAVTFRPDGQRRANRTRDHLGVEVTETVLGIGAETMGRRDVEVTALRYDPGGTVLVAGYADGAVRLLDPERGEPLGGWQLAEGPVSELAVAPDGGWVAALSGKARHLDVMVPDEPAHRLPRRGVRCLLATADAQLWIGGREAILRITPLDPEAPPRLHLDSEGLVTALALDPNGLRLAAGSPAGPVWIYRLDGPAGPVLETTWEGGAARSSQGLAFSSNGVLLAASQADAPRRISVVGVERLTPVARYNVMLQEPRAISFLPDQRSVAYAGGLSSGIGGNYISSAAYRRRRERR